MSRLPNPSGQSHTVTELQQSITINKSLFYALSLSISVLLSAATYTSYKLYHEIKRLKQLTNNNNMSHSNINGDTQYNNNNNQNVKFDDKVQSFATQSEFDQYVADEQSYYDDQNNNNDIDYYKDTNPMHDKTARDAQRYSADGLQLAIIVVDPISTGANIAHEVSRRGFQVISLLSGFLSDTLLNLIDPSIKVEYAAIITHNLDKPDDTIIRLHNLKNLHIVGLITGSEPGVEVAEEIAEKLGLPGNGTIGSEARRDKYLMGESIRAAGIRAVQQRKCNTWEQVDEFINEWNPVPFKVVIKPVKSAGSDHVYLCESVDELKLRFDTILGHNNQLGFMNDCVLIQEYLSGSEYVVDTVSLNGHHKVAAIWKYDKRKHAGYNFVYYGQEAVDTSQSFCSDMSEYLFRVLDAVGIHDSAGHAEVILTETGPCLVEVGARSQGGEGTFIPLANMTWGYNQVEMVVAAQISVDEFNLYPDTLAAGLMIYGYKVDLVSGVSGKLIKLQHLDKIEQLESFIKFDFLPVPGQQIHITIDCFTEPGSLTLAHKHKSQLDSDLAKLREYEQTMFVVEPGTEDVSVEQGLIN